jgi:hypothetical protein
LRSSGAVVATLSPIVVPILYWELRRHEFARVSDLEITNGEADARVAA